MESLTLSREALDQIKLFVLDMDGTFYLGNRIIDGALDFLEAARKRGKKIVFFTNNSSKAPEDYIHKLAAMNCYISKNELMTSGDVTIDYLQNQYHGKRVYLVGTKELTRCFREAGIYLVDDEPDIVVVSFDTSLTYQKLMKACTYIRNGALFLATHLDINCPTENGMIPDCGAFCAAITLSTGASPIYLGKPFPPTVEMILSKTGCHRDEIAFIGDRIYTDVAAGVNNGSIGILVLSGETRLEDLHVAKIKPHAVYQTLGDILPDIK